MQNDASSETENKPVSAVELSTLTLDALRRVAEHSRDSGMRSAARREIETRIQAASGALEPAYRVTVERSEYGTPLPAARVSVGGRAREARATAHELAAAFERHLATTREGWTVGVSGSGEAALVTVELMDATPPEVTRAVAALERVVSEVGGTVRRAGRRPKRTDATDKAAPADAPADAEAEPTSGAEDRSRRRRRQKYREAAGDAADSFEAELVERLGDDVPDFVVSGAKGSDYWRWLLDQYRASHGGRLAASVG